MGSLQDRTHSYGRMHSAVAQLAVPPDPPLAVPPLPPLAVPPEPPLAVPPVPPGSFEDEQAAVMNAAARAIEAKRFIYLRVPLPEETGSQNQLIAGRQSCQ